MIRIVLLTLVAVVMAAPRPESHQMDNVWEEFKTNYQRSYGRDIEFARKQIFLTNLAKIQMHNIEADMGKHTYWQGVNQFTDMTNEEYRQKVLGVRFSPNRPSNASRFLSPENIGDLPHHVDWRPKGYVTPVKNQAQCGSCWAFSATGSLEGQHFRKTGKLVSLSEQNLVDCSQAEGNQGCNGGLMDQAYEYIKQNHGIDTEVCYKYEAIDDKCRFKTACIGATVSGFTDVESGSEMDLQKAVATVGPVAVAIDASHGSFQSYSHGIYSEPYCSSTELDHGVLAVGYGQHVGASDGEKDFWLVKNSWGESWGVHGYIMMSRNKNNQCGIATQASYPLV